MNLYSLVLVALRLMALGIFFKGALETLPNMILFNANTVAQSGKSQSGLIGAYFGLFVIASILFWGYSPSVANAVCGKNAAKTISFGRLSLIDSYTIAFTGVGISMLAKGVPDIIGWVVTWLMSLKLDTRSAFLGQFSSFPHSPFSLLERFSC